jgi:NADPH:quinone reductase-like Zn-dependent oxidoreductase
MKAAVVREAGRPPEFSEFPEPRLEGDEAIVTMLASAVNPLTIMRASGRHYSYSTPPPFVAGNDGVGRTGDGTRVYVAQPPRPPYGTFAERVPVARASLLRLPEGLPDALAAAVAIPGLSCWNPLVHRAQIHSGDSVLVHGATGAAGHMAIQIAKHLGARSVVATGRNRAKLDALRTIGAERLIPLDQPAEAIRDAVRDAVRDLQVGVILDYLWGPTAAAVIAGAGGPDAPRGPATIRYVQIGAITGPSVPLESAILRSSGLEILGSGIGSSTSNDLLESLTGLFAATVSAGFKLDTDVRPLSEIGSRWGATGEDRRLVFSLA